MIGYIEGKILKIEEERVLVLANQVGYEILLPAYVMETLRPRKVGDQIALYVFYQQTERQPKPILIGFNLEAEKEFFQSFISVEDIGPLKAVKALSVPVSDVAEAIENRDVQRLTRLKGIGARTAQKIIATLEGKMGKFALIRKADKPENMAVDDFPAQVFEVLVKQLGHKTTDAKRMIADALKRKPAMISAEQLLDEIYRGQKL
ncbi:MAG: Holliday junction branch migration protein RuvA [Desulfobacterales bacterium]|nr:Holliday junction branch migration protein RuvA [Desulfobacterales bacterium]